MNPPRYGDKIGASGCSLCGLLVSDPNWPKFDKLMLDELFSDIFKYFFLFERIEVRAVSRIIFSRTQ